MQNNNVDDLTQFAREAIQSIGEKALSYYGQGDRQIKFDERLITEAELTLTDHFQSQLHAQFPEHQLFKNNQENKSYSHEGKRYLWVFDPVDGIANFQAGIPVWGISMALLENFWPVFGIFYMPAIGDLFHAQAGHNAFLGKKKITVSAQDTINDESLLLTYSRFHHQYRTTFPGKIRDFGCTVAHMCYVAMGCAEAAFIAQETYQDLAAARIIIEAAGAKIFKIDGSELFLNEYLDGQRINDDLLVVSPDNCSQVRSCLREIS